MKTLHVNNVNEGLQVGMMLLKSDGEEIFSRNGNTIEYPGPVTTTYYQPWRRVLFDPLRDANPFFHFMEALWILAGREDVAFLDPFNSQMKKYSDDGIVFHGAYGHRMRRRFKDQLTHAITQLQIDPLTRRCVVQIWDASIDNAHHLDIPCNDMIFFRARNGVLDMTVLNRSNDIIWGCYGANAVHFSIVHEYVATHAGLRMGRYHQVSNSYHAYTDNPYWLAWEGGRFETDLYENALVDVPQFPLFDAKHYTDIKLLGLMDWIMAGGLAPHCQSTDPGFMQIAIPMFQAWQCHKQSNYDDAVLALSKMPAGARDWKLACSAWLAVRQAKKSKFELVKAAT